MIFDIVSVLALLFVGGALVMAVRDRFHRTELSLVWLSFFAHVVAMFGQVWITVGYYGGGDMTNYQDYGTQLADAMKYDPATFVPLNLAILFQQQDIALPFYVLGAGTSTGSMSALDGFISLIDGESIFGTSLVIALWAFFGKLSMYHAFRLRVPPELRLRVLVAVLLVPSVVFWSCGILKESVAIGALGLMVLGLHYFVTNQRVRGLPLMVLGALIVGLFKPYILFPFALGAGVWYFLQRFESRGEPPAFKPVYLIAGGIIAVGGVVMLGHLFPAYALESLGEEAARQQEIGSRFVGGSQYAMGNPGDKSLGGQLMFAPFALLTALFRPLAFESRNVLMAFNALETTILVVYAVRFVFQQSLIRAWSTLRSSPMLMFCATFVVTLGVAVGLATTNLGTLSRYRMPLVPCFATILLVVPARARQLARRQVAQASVNVAAALHDQ
jgi:hypothetical protein